MTPVLMEHMCCNPCRQLYRHHLVSPHSFLGKLSIWRDGNRKVKTPTQGPLEETSETMSSRDFKLFLASLVQPELPHTEWTLLVMSFCDIVHLLKGFKRENH